MNTCERCGDRDIQAHVKLFEARFRDSTEARLALCCSCAEIWETVAPGEWVTLPQTDLEEPLEVLRLYWPCDFCTSIVRYDGVAVRVNRKGAEWIVCEECQLKYPGLLPPKVGPA